MIPQTDDRTPDCHESSNTFLAESTPDTIKKPFFFSKEKQQQETQIKSICR